MQNFLSFLLSSLLMVLLLDAAHCKKVQCKDRCCSFVENMPAKLKTLRSSYDQIRDYYEDNNDLDNNDLDVALLSRAVLEYFESPYGCHVVNDVLQFYLDTVLPTAVTEHRYKTQIDEIGNIFQQLKREIVQCRNYFACKKPFEISSIKNSYTKMKTKGLYKAMGELDLLFNYIEDYLASKRQAQ